MSSTCQRALSVVDLIVGGIWPRLSCPTIMVSKLNYSKWDNLELSDDSDIEVHPNVDKRSFIRWKQRDIHEKREMRKIQRSHYEAEHRTNVAVAPILEELCKATEKEGSKFYSREVSRLSAGRQERGNKDGPDGPTLDDIVLSLLLQINEEEDVAKARETPQLDQALANALKTHIYKLATRTKELETLLKEMDDEDRRKITSESLRDGWNSSHVTKSDDLPPQTQQKPSGKTKVQHVETLNPGASSVSQPATANDSEEEEEEDSPSITPVMKAFASLPSALKSVPISMEKFPPGFNPATQLNLNAFEKMFDFLSAHKELLRSEYGTSDALLLQAFESQMAGQKSLARMCTEKALLVQYCNQLGKDGVNLFFQRMMQTDGRAAVVFLNDVLSTYTRISSRADVMKEKYKDEGEGVEQIQLMAEDPNTVISFQIPEGPPPENIKLEGEGADKLDPSQVHEWLQRRWDIFVGFDEDFRRALETKNLDTVNQALGRMPVEKAEMVVQDLDRAGILNFSSTEIRDETGKT